MKFLLVEEFIKYIQSKEKTAKEINFHDCDISMLDPEDLKAAFSKIPAHIATLIVPNKDFFAFFLPNAPDVFLRMQTIQKALPAHVTTIKVDKRMVEQLSLA